MGIEKEDDSKILGAIAFEKKEHWKQVIKGIMLLVFGMLTFILLYDPNKNGHLEAFYATLISATTVGYGDIAPSSNWAKVISAFVLPVLTAVFADFFGTELVGGGSKLSEQLNCDLSGWKDDFIADLERENEATATESGEALQTATGVQEAQRLHGEDKIEDVLNQKDAEIKELMGKQEVLQKEKEKFEEEMEESKASLVAQQAINRQVLKEMMKYKGAAKQEEAMEKADTFQADETKKFEETNKESSAKLQEQKIKLQEQEQAKAEQQRILQEQQRIKEEQERKKAETLVDTSWKPDGELPKAQLSPPSKVKVGVVVNWGFTTNEDRPQGNCFKIAKHEQQYKDVLRALPDNQDKKFKEAFDKGIYDLPVWYPAEENGQRYYTNYIKQGEKYRSYGTGDPNGQQTAQMYSNTANLKKMQTYGKDNEEASKEMKKILQSGQDINLEKPFGPFVFVDYGLPPEKTGDYGMLSEGLGKLLEEFTRFEKCVDLPKDEKRSTIILYGGSGAGKTKNTNAIMSQMEKYFGKEKPFNVEIGITEVVPVGEILGAQFKLSDLGTIDLVEQASLDGECVEINKLGGGIKTKAQNYLTACTPYDVNEEKNKQIKKLADKKFEWREAGGCLKHSTAFEKCLCMDDKKKNYVECK